MGATGLVNPALQFFANNGDPLAGGSVYTYQAGTTTLQATYTDSGLSVPNTNPIVLNSAGRCVIYPPAVTPALKIIVKDSNGVTIYTQDNISPAAVGA